MCLLLSCCLFSCNSKENNEGNDDTGTKDPRFSTISKIVENAKKEFGEPWYFRFRIFNPLYAVNNLGISKLNYDNCIKEFASNNYFPFLNGNMISAIPSYSYYVDDEYSNAYYDVVYNGILQEYDADYETLQYKLKGFSFNISLIKYDEIFTSSLENNKITLSSMDTKDAYSIFGKIDADFSDFDEGETIDIDNANFTHIKKWSRYQAKNTYNDVQYWTISVISPLKITDNSQSFLIKNIIKVQEKRYGFLVEYFISELSEVNYLFTNAIEFHFEDMDANPILTPLRAKTIDMAQSFIDHSLDYLNE